MVKEFSIAGSCVSRVIFNSNINKDYKNFFHINYSVEGVPLISLMSNPTIVDSKLISCDNSFGMECINNDFSKKFLDFLKKDKLDYLIIDNYWDSKSNIIYLDSNQYIVDSQFLKKTKIYNYLSKNKRLSIQSHFNEYFSLYKNACKLFFEFVEANCLNLKIILNCGRHVYKYYSGNNLVVDENLKKLTKFNCYWDILDKYILENFDVEVLPFDKTTLAYKSHLFNLHSTHYEPKYYLDKTNQLNDIIKRNETFEFNNKFNREIRNLKRKNLIFQFKQNLFLKNENNNKFLIDFGVEKNKNSDVWFSFENGLINTDYDGTTIKHISGDFLQIVAKKSNVESWYSWKSPFTVELDIIKYENQNNAFRVQSKNNGGTCTFEELNLTNKSHVKIICDNSILFYVNDEYKLSKPINNFFEDFIVEIRLFDGGFIKYKNFVIY